MDSKKGVLNAPASKSTRGPAKQNGRGRKRLRVQDDSDDDASDDGKCSSKRKKLDSGQSQTQAGADERRQPALVTGAKLKDYQLEGVEWMISLDQNGISGILGKSLSNQTIPTAFPKFHIPNIFVSVYICVCTDSSLTPADEMGLGKVSIKRQLMMPAFSDPQILARPYRQSHLMLIFANEGIFVLS